MDTSHLAGGVAMALCLFAETGLAPAADPGWTRDARTGCKVWFPLPLLKDSATWSGACVNGAAEGTGTERWLVDGQQVNQLVGRYHEGRPQGTVVATYANGDKYIGDLGTGGVPADGQGVYQWSGGDRYEGGFTGGVPNGRGAFTFITDGLLVANTLSNIVLSNSQILGASDTETLVKQALSIREKALGPDHPDVAQSLNALADSYNEQGRYIEAEPLFRRALAIREKALGPDHRDVAESLNGLAENFGYRGRYAESEPLYRRALDIREKVLGPNHSDVAQTLNDLAADYYEQGQYSDAEPLIQRALEIRKKAFGADHTKYAESLNDLAEIYDVQGRYAIAEPMYREALEIEEKAFGPNHTDVALTLNDLALNYTARHRYAEAEPLFKRARAIREKILGPDDIDVAETLNDLADSYNEQGRYSDAEPLFRRALAIREKVLLPDHRYIKLSLASLTTNYYRQKRFSEALPLLRRLLDSQGNFPLTALLPVVVGSRKAGLIDINEALSLSLNVLQKSNMSGASDAVGKLAQRFAGAAGEQAKLIRRDQDLANQWMATDKRLMAQFSEPPELRERDTESNLRRSLDAVQAQRKDIAATLTQRFPDYVALIKPPALQVADIQAVLDDDEALVAIEPGEKSFAWVVTRTAADWTEIPVSANTLNDEVRTLREAMAFDPNEKAAKPFDTALAFKVYQQTFGPIGNKIVGKKRLSVYVDGALTSLPLQVLVIADPAGKRYADVDWLMKSFAITNLPSIYSLKAMRRQLPPSRATKPMIAFADPVFSREARVDAWARPQIATRGMPGFYVGTRLDAEALAHSLRQLHETRNEVATVGKALDADPADEIFGLSATPSAVKQAKLDQYRVVYFATHALVAGDIETFTKAKAEPALALTFPDKPTEEDNGLLPASEVAQLKLDADWVVLSACNTAAGDTPGAEALSGLARAFIYAGARSLVVSHWEVSDVATAKLMTRLFQIGRENPGLSHGEMLRAASLRLLDTAQTDEGAHPRLWAPFVVVGEPPKPAPATAAR